VISLLPPQEEGGERRLFEAKEVNEEKQGGHWKRERERKSL